MSFMGLKNGNQPPELSGLELWGGPECTVNRVHGEYLDQLRFTGHDERLSDLDRFAELGISAIRYPVIWERVAPESLDAPDWSWSDERLNHLRALKIRPIAGLLHHGSGPQYTDLLDTEFPQKLARYAGMVAERYPWLDAYTPVNEPLTTARFSGLYGVWYPHAADDSSFVRALMNEIAGTVLAMREIRKINPAAQLIQTEDLSKIFSTQKLQYQADFENHRRWLAFDLLRGKVTNDHSLWKYLRRFGVGADELQQLVDEPCAPDICGFNYYLSSERFLDHRLELYPSRTRGGNHKEDYVDVEAARVLAGGISGVGNLLTEAWERFESPVAITEIHNGCTREEQLRWFVEIVNECSALRNQGVDVRAVTAWSLLGAMDWNTLVTRRNGAYEAGVFDIRSPQPRKTAIGHVLESFASGRTVDHPVLDSPGWWHRTERFDHGHSIEANESIQRKPALIGFQRPRRLLITGASGTLGNAFLRLCRLRGLQHVLLSRAELDIADADSVRHAFDEIKPWAVINAAGYVRVDDAENDHERCFRENTTGAAELAIACSARNTRLLTFSSDLVFDGSKGVAYLESDPVSPLNVYGEAKAEAERLVLQADPSALVVRTSAFFSPWDEHNFVTLALRAMAKGEPFAGIENYVVSPTYVPDLVNASLDLLIDGESGIWHLVNEGSITWAELARFAAVLANVEASSLRSVCLEEMGLAARRPYFSALASERGELMPSLEDALARYVLHCEIRWLVEDPCIPNEPVAA